MTIHKTSSFIHKCYINVARELWKNPYLLYVSVPGHEYQRNSKEIENIIKYCVENTIRHLLPIKEILKEHLDNENDNKAFAKKFSFPYPLLCDVNREIALGYHAVKSKEDQYAARISYVIGEEGKILESIENVDTKNHSKDLCSRY